MSVRPLFAIAGNPNTGKTTLFNALTGHRAKVGNYPGITVERRLARLTLPDVGAVELVDIPGTYSLLARTVEEQIALDSLLGLRGAPRPDAVIMCVAATQLSRSTYLVLQAQEMGLQVIVALTMGDEAGPAAPDPAALAKQLSCDVVPVLARTGQGLDTLRAAMAAAVGAESELTPRWRWTPSAPLRAHLDAVQPAMPGRAVTPWLCGL